MSKNDLDEVLANAEYTPTAEDVTTHIYGKKEEPNNTVTVTKPRASKADIPLDQMEEVPDGFPEGTILNEDSTLTLPDGRMIRKIEQETSNEEAN